MCQEKVLAVLQKKSDLTEIKSLSDFSKNALLEGGIITPRHITHLNNYLNQLFEADISKSHNELDGIVEKIEKGDIDSLLDELNFEEENENDLWNNFGLQQEERGQSEEVFEILGTLMTLVLNIAQSNSLRILAPSFSKNGISFFADVPHRKKLFCYLNIVSLFDVFHD